MSRRDLRELKRLAAALGYTTAATRGGHVEYRLPSGTVVVASGTPGDFRNRRNVVAQLRRTVRRERRACPVNSAHTQE